VQQNADISLSCHHNNTNSKTGVSNLRLGPDIGEFGDDKQPALVIETRLACDASLAISIGPSSPWVILRAESRRAYPLLPGLREGSVGSGEIGKGVFWPGFRKRAGSVAGPCVVVDFEMRAEIAS
jgi:hypothetical protein